MNESISMREVRAEGARNAIRDTTREKTIRILETRFPDQVTTSIRERIRAQTDVAVLDRWFDLALASRDLDSFLRDCS